MSHTFREVKKGRDRKISEKIPQTQQTRKIPVRMDFLRHTRRKVKNTPTASALARLVDGFAAADSDS